ncbi:MAG: hypothetical protein K6F82_05005 [Sphaerochaetaceae bacterium]|nr:hypothetical protein [Sphaerochaetaceae bacterium]
MKKAFSIIILFVLLIGSVLAADNAVTFSARPYALQISSSSEDGQDPVTSTYGGGAEIVYSRYLTEGISIESGISWDSFKMPDDRETFSHFMAFAGASYNYDISSLFAGSVHAAAGLDLLVYEEITSATFTLLTGLDFSYCFAENFYLDLGCDGSFGFASKDDINYVNYRVLPKLGVSFEF